MFLKINVKNVTEGYVFVPVHKAQYLEEVIELFEKNAVWVDDTYNSRSVKPVEITANLGDSVVLEADSYYPEKTKLTIHSGSLSGTIPTTAENMTPEVYAHIQEQNKTWKDLLEKEKLLKKQLEEEVSYLKRKITHLEEKGEEE